MRPIYYFGLIMGHEQKIKGNKKPYAFLKKTNVNKDYKNCFQEGLIIIILASFIYSGCAGQGIKNNLANSIAKASNLQPIFIPTSTFKLKGYFRFYNPKAPLTIYIEGDGQAYLHRNMPSSNPTPKNPLALRLAAIDLGENILYLARPCQYVNFQLERFCKIPYWTQKRFSSEVIISVNEAIDKMVLKAGVDRIHLVGYSGGGAVAALVASRRTDVASLRTLAGYVDHVSLNRRVGVSSLKGSLDPMKVAPNLKRIPQIHYSGKNDKVIPKWVPQNFIRAVGNKNCVFIRLINATHTIGWEKAWKEVWSKIPACR